MQNTVTETPILEFDPDDCLPTDDNRPAERSSLGRLVEGIRLHGQLVPGLVCPHPEIAEKYLILDGVGRREACLRLGLRFRAMRLAGIVPEKEQIKLRLQHNALRQNMTPGEIADDADRYMKLTGATQEDVAQVLTLSSATVSRALSISRRIPEELRHFLDDVRPSVAAMIASLPSIEDKRAAFEYATTAGTNGKPTRDQVARYLKRFKRNPSRGTKRLCGTINGRRFELGLLTEDTPASLGDFLKELAAKVSKKSTIDSLDTLFAS